MSYFRSADPDIDFLRYDRQQAQAMSQLRRCDGCGKAIQDDYYFEVYGDILCEKCMNERFRQVND